MPTGTITLSGPPDIDVTLRESSRARRLSLRVSSLDGSVTLTRPRGISAAEAVRFVNARREWIESAVSRVPSQVLVTIGSTVPIGGDTVPILAGTGRAARRTADGLEVPAARAGAVVAAYVKARARDALADACDRYSAAIGCDYSEIALRDTRSRWGSCTTAGRLMFSWRLAMAPLDVLEYVAAHEVAHLRHMDHSRAFWRTVEGMIPGWRAHRDWLRVRGPDLHRYRFAT